MVQATAQLAGMQEEGIGWRMLLQRRAEHLRATMKQTSQHIKRFCASASFGSTCKRPRALGDQARSDGLQVRVGLREGQQQVVQGAVAPERALRGVPRDAPRLLALLHERHHLGKQRSVRVCGQSTLDTIKKA